jgi:hypothetical protein
LMFFRHSELLITLNHNFSLAGMLFMQLKSCFFSQSSTYQKLTPFWFTAPCLDADYSPPAWCPWSQQPLLKLPIRSLLLVLVLLMLQNPAKTRRQWILQCWLNTLTFWRSCKAGQNHSITFMPLFLSSNVAGATE